MGWALDNLGSARCREIAESLMKVEKVYGTKLHGFCPVHGDTKSASAFYNFDRDSGGCRSCGEKWDLIKLWCLVHGLAGDDIKAFRAEFDNDYTAGKPKPGLKLVKKTPPTAPPPAPEVFVDEAELEALPPLTDEMIQELKDKRGWIPSVIEILDLRLFVDAKKNNRIAIPIRTDEGKLGNVRLYQRGADNFKLISWFDRKCPHCGGAWKIVKKSKTCQACGKTPNDYGRTRLFPPPSQWKPGTIWLCEGIQRHTD